MLKEPPLHGPVSSCVMGSIRSSAPEWRRPSHRDSDCPVWLMKPPRQMSPGCLQTLRCPTNHLTCSEFTLMGCRYSMIWLQCPVPILIFVCTLHTHFNTEWNGIICHCLTTSWTSGTYVLLWPQGWLCSVADIPLATKDRRENGLSTCDLDHTVGPKMLQHTITSCAQVVDISSSFKHRLKCCLH